MENLTSVKETQLDGRHTAEIESGQTEFIHLTFTAEYAKIAEIGNG
jgi:hypothetical protein